MRSRTSPLHVLPVLLAGLFVVGAAGAAQEPSPAASEVRLAIARSDPGGGSEILVMDADGTDAVTVFHHPGPATIDSLGWSPDGTRLAFDLGVALTAPIDTLASVPPELDRRWETHLIDLASGGIVPLHLDLPHDADATWLGDGTLVTHTWPAGADWGPRELHHWTADGQPAAPIEIPDGRLVPVVYPAPDGMRFTVIAMGRDLDDTQLLLYDSRTLQRDAIGRDSNNSRLVWSPDGRWLVQSDDDPDDRLIMFDTWEDRQRDLTEPGAMPDCNRTCSSIGPVAWSADGSRVLAAASSDGRSSLYAIDVSADSIDPYRTTGPAVDRLAEWPERVIDRLPGPADGPVVLVSDRGLVLHVAGDGRSATRLDERFTDGAQPIAVTPDGASLVVTRDGAVWLMALDDGRTVDELVAPGPERIEAVAYWIEGRTWLPDRS